MSEESNLAAERHVPVMPVEVAERLALRPGETFLDCTAGLGGHAADAAAAVGASGRVILNDVDPGNLESASARITALGVPVTTLRGNFADIGFRMSEANLAADAVLADLGFSSNQMEDPERGLSFMRDGPLDMRLDPTLPSTAADLVNSLSESDLAAMIEEFGEDYSARRIARKLVQVRAGGPILTTSRLAEAVRSAVPGQRGGGKSMIDPATKTFQALRIAVNDELGCLGAMLKAIESRAGRAGWLKPGARVVFIAFHSLEDRLVKRSFAELVKARGASEVGDQGAGPTDDEVARNPRSRSAKIRAIRFPEK
ncbi:MAG: 16S rRNA (cytosine(1402)-N(4))-methyltransferase RsmH [Phycisphaerales bacterium]